MPRPSSPILTKDRIVDAALAAVDGTGDFTMPGIAAALKVRPSSLYNHVGGRAEIIELLRDRVMAAVVLPEGNRPAVWTDVVSAVARSYRGAYGAHPRLIPLLTGQTARSRSAVAMYETFAQAFRAGGMDAREILDAITVIDAFVLGSALDLAAPSEVWSVDATEDPGLIEVLQHAEHPDRADRAFESGLAVLIAGWLAHTGRT